MMRSIDSPTSTSAHLDVIASPISDHMSAGRYRFLSKERICAVKERSCEHDGDGAGELPPPPQAAVGGGDAEKPPPLEIRAVNIVFFQEWLYKKGSGVGWFGSLNWRPRFTKLVSAHLDDSSVAVPVLLNYWHESDLEASSSVLLKECVAVPVDRECSYGNMDCFDIVHPKRRTVRSFAVPSGSRDEWVVTINSVVAKFERAMRDYRREHAEKSTALPPLPPPSPRAVRAKRPPAVKTAPDGGVRSSRVDDGYVKRRQALNTANSGSGRSNIFDDGVKVKLLRR
eukprot:CAMPEP_0194265292 /NCGR_PEP_ID=MMETSP0169-20130528/592_1 /TAXON_ID=218684 /ORGANISM="Corethron pennatum, Strain L29A3" /LENGTH=283 /DNA_ID=CAMNT_0039005731 /DNA_START=138 /DNA_END=985 /DNA_ORIENTATION=-